MIDSPNAGPSYDSSALPRSAPESQGVESGAILNLLRAIRKHPLELHSIMILRHGHVIAEGWWEPYHRDGVQLLYSLSKSFTATAVGLAVNEGHLDLDAFVTSFFPDSLPDSIPEHLAAMRVRHLLMMATGHRDDTIEEAIAADGDWVKGFLQIPPDDEPGSRFTYNNGATHVLAAIVQLAVGEDLLNFLRPRLLDPLGIREARWQTAPDGVRFGFSGLRLTTESVARFGQLHLQRGLWNGERLLREEWIDEATRLQVLTDGEENPDWRQGYGFQFWRSQYGYRGDGAFGQFCIVLPEHDLVIATTAATEDMQALIDLFWIHLLPSLHPVAVPPSDDHRRLTHELDSLTLEAVQGCSQPSASTRTLPRFGAIARAPFDVGFTPFEAVSLRDEPEGWVIHIESNGRLHRIYCPPGRWHTTHIDDQDANRRMISASGAWTAPDVFTAELVYAESPHRLRLQWRADADAQPPHMSWNVAPIGPWAE